MSRRSTGIARRSRSAVSTCVFSSASEGSRGMASQASTRPIHCSAGDSRHPGVEVIRRDPVGGLLVVAGHESCRERRLDGQCRARPVGMQARARRGEVAQRQPSAAQDAGRVHRPVVEQVAHQRERLARVQGRLPVDVVGVVRLALAGAGTGPFGQRCAGDELADRHDRAQPGRRPPHQGKADQVVERGSARVACVRRERRRQPRRRGRQPTWRSRSSARRRCGGRAGASHRGRPGTWPPRDRRWLEQ